jgi:hypothetical protein
MPSRDRPRKEDFPDRYCPECVPEPGYMKPYLNLFNELTGYTCYRCMGIYKPDDPQLYDIDHRLKEIDG